jgi:hypothetical protein
MTDSDVATVASAVARPRLSWSTALTILAFSIMTVYASAVSLHTIDVETKIVAADFSLQQYRQVLAGERGFPYQWRVLGTYMVYAGERLTGLPPHTIDIALKTLLLWTSTMLLFLFSQWYTSESGAYAVVGYYMLLNVPAFNDEQYSIYFTNDYAMLVCWFAAVYFIRLERFGWATLMTFIGAWAKETMLLVPVLLGLGALRSPKLRVPFVVTSVAFMIPTVILRTAYPAPLAKWAWWDMVFTNVPFLQRSLDQFKATIKNNIKVALFYNVFWVLAARRVLSGSDRFATDLAITCVVYLLLAYPVIYIRELRHFLPLAIVVLPLAINAIEQRSADRLPAWRRAP